MARNNNFISRLTSLGGFMMVAIFVGIYLDQRYFKNGIIVIVMPLIVIFLLLIDLIRFGNKNNDT